MSKTDKKKQINFTISVPLWLYEPWERTAYTFRKWTYWAFPDHCACCGKRMFVKNYEIEHHFDNHRRLMVGNHCRFDNKWHTVCRDCLANELEHGEWEPRFTHFHEERGESVRYNYRFWSTKKCAITDKEVRSYKDVEIYPYVDMTFCTIAWNHDYISKEAVIECVRKGNIKTSIWGVWKRSVMKPMNHKRLFIDDKGELL